MSLDTPRKKKQRDNLVKKFAGDWAIDLPSGPTLKYKRKIGLSGVWQKLFGRKHSVFAMYWFFKNQYLNDEEIRKFFFPLKHDNMPVKGVPFKYELLGTWNIEDKDLKYLYGGPLIDQDGELIVPVDTKMNVFIRFCKMATPPIALFSAILGVLIKWPSIITMF